MSQESVSVESSKITKAVSISRQGGGMKWKIATAFSGLLIVLGLLVIGIVYRFAGNALQRQVDLRSSAIATNLSDAAAGYVSRRSSLELDVLMAKYGRLDGVAYAYIQDPKGEIVASSLQPFPTELKDGSAPREQRVAKSRLTSVRGKSVYETQIPLLDGQLGAVHVGLWADIVEQDVLGTVLPIIGLIALCLAIGIAVSIIIATSMVRPVLELKSVADEISRGNLDAAVPTHWRDEVGDLARSLERMRASLKAAMARLNRV